MYRNIYIVGVFYAQHWSIVSDKVKKIVIMCSYIPIQPIATMGGYNTEHGQYNAQKYQNGLCSYVSAQIHTFGHLPRSKTQEKPLATTVAMGYIDRLVTMGTKVAP